MAKGKKKPEDSGLPFGPKNYALMGAALVFIILGFIFLGSGDITLAPILLVLGYCVLFPIGIIWKDRAKNVETEK